jgi:hypothetical protein
MQRLAPEPEEVFTSEIVACNKSGYTGYGR